MGNKSNIVEPTNLLIFTVWAKLFRLTTCLECILFCLNSAMDLALYVPSLTFGGRLQLRFEVSNIDFDPFCAVIVSGLPKDNFYRSSIVIFTSE